METLAKENMFYHFSKDREAAVTVPPGTTLTLETYDCFENQVTEEGDNYGEIDWDRINPATGPVYIEEAEPGDCLKVTIDKIELADYGMMAVGKGLGVMKEEMEDLIFKKIPLRQNKGDFGYGISLDLNPMIGVIGVAPGGDPVSNGTPGDHGGNMDNKKIEEGAVLYFPVSAPGALFGLGDMHAAMGDGEVGVTGIEAAGRATVTFEVIKNKKLSMPLLENDSEIGVISSAPTLEQGIHRATSFLAGLLARESDMDKNNAVMFLSAAGQVEVCQVVDPLVTVRMMLQKKDLEPLNISFP